MGNYTGGWISGPLRMLTSQLLWRQGTCHLTRTWKGWGECVCVCVWRGGVMSRSTGFHHTKSGKGVTYP